MTIRFAAHNVANLPSAFTKAMGQGDYVVLNECRAKAKAAIVAATRAPNLRSYMRAGSQNVHAWRMSEVGVLAHGGRLVLQGGRRGAGKAARDKRRRGPNRDASWQLIYDVDTFALLIVVDWHNIARFTTSERWRRPLAMAALVKLRALLVVLMRRYPGVPIAVAGDGNDPTLGSWRLGPKWRTVHTPADFGRRHYTQVYLRGPVIATKVRKFASSSDHDGLAMDLAVQPGAPTFKPTA